ncbi:MAG: hypothetical protein ACLRL6_19555, partial [Clostridium sp.]
NTNMQVLAKGLQDGSDELNASLTDEMLKSLTQGLENVTAMQTVFDKDQKAVAQGVADLKTALTSEDVNHSTDELNKTAAYLQAQAFDSTTGAVIDEKAAQALQSLKNANGYLASYKTNVATSAAELEKQLTQLQTDSANLKNLSDMASSAANMLPKLNSLKTSLHTASQGAQQLAQGTQQLSDKASSLMELKKGITTLDSSLSSAVGGSSELYKGSQSLTAGLQKVDQGAGTLQNGSAVISSGAVQLYDASTLLKDKTGELHAGMSKFKTSGIDEMKKQVNLSLDDVTQLLAIKDEIVKEAEQEHTFSGAPKNSSSKVKYIYKTEELQKEKKADTNENKKTKEET